MALLGYNANEVEDSGIGQPLPAGKYVMIATGDEQKPTQSGGQYISLEMTVHDGGPKQGRKVWENLNIVNSNPVAENIGRATLNRLALAAGIQAADFVDSSQVLNIPVVVTVAIDTKDTSRNKIKKFEAWDGVSIPNPVATQAAARVATPPVATTPAAPPYAMPATPPTPPTPPAPPAVG